MYRKCLLIMMHILLVLAEDTKNTTLAPTRLSTNVTTATTNVATPSITVEMFSITVATASIAVVTPLPNITSSPAGQSKLLALSSAPLKITITPIAPSSSSGMQSSKSVTTSPTAVPGVKPIYKQLTYALGGTSGFLLLVVVIMACTCRRKKNDEAYEYSKELDDFTIANKRASMVEPGVLHAYDNEVQK